MIRPWLIAVALAGGVLATWIARRAAWRLGIVNAPNPIVPQHTRPVAYLGGIGIAGGAAAALMAAEMSGATLLALPGAGGLLLGALGYLALGTYDDVRPLQPLSKLVAQLAVAAAAVASARSGAALPQLIAATVWLVVVVNAVNLTDVCDGLVGSLAVASLIGLAAVSPAAAPLALLLGAACVGFLAFNRPPASIFLGDGGSHLLGFGIAALWLVVLDEAFTWSRAAAAVLGAGAFLFELSFLIVVRSRRGLPFWRGSPDHLALRLQAAGLTKQRTVALAVAVAAALAAAGVWLARAPGVAPAAVALLLLGALTIAAQRLYAREPVPVRGRAREAQELLR